MYSAEVGKYIISDATSNTQVWDVSDILNIPYDKTYILDQIYNYFQILKREDNEDNIKLQIFGNEKRIAKIIAQIKK